MMQKPKLRLLGVKLTAKREVSEAPVWWQQPCWRKVRERERWGWHKSTLSLTSKYILPNVWKKLMELDMGLFKNVRCPHIYSEFKKDVEILGPAVIGRSSHGFVWKHGISQFWWFIFIMIFRWYPIIFPSNPTTFPLYPITCPLHPITSPLSSFVHGYCVLLRVLTPWNIHPFIVGCIPIKL
jgi:hypothetical protein